VNEIKDLRESVGPFFMPDVQAIQLRVVLLQDIAPVSALSRPLVL
jgi:hypothetical protein